MKSDDKEIAEHNIEGPSFKFGDMFSTLGNGDVTGIGNYTRYNCGKVVSSIRAQAVQSWRERSG